ncbi:uncharacterized protein LOC142776478 [Rhipicephalus microplus]|uniref:uncharacterized protein LOC142776478 n=1 Tax=Rhipicephalus microplus TaxID=6941 RepID=UPI003F6CD0A7
MAKGWVSLLAACVAGFTVLFQNEVDQDRWVASQSITLKASGADAFRFVASSEYMSKWLPFVSSVVEADGKQMSIGKRYRATYELPLIGEVDTWYNVVEYQPYGRVAVQSESWLRPRLELRVETTSESQCRMHVLVSFRRKSYLFQYTLGPVLHFVSNQQLQRSLFLLRMVFPQ